MSTLSHSNTVYEENPLALEKEKEKRITVDQWILPFNGMKIILDSIDPSAKNYFHLSVGHNLSGDKISVIG